MRDLGIALVMGVFFFAGGAVMTALAIKYATPGLLWDIVLWGGILGMALSAANIIMLAIYYLSDAILRTQRPILGPAILMNLAICLAVGSLIWHFSEAPIAQLLPDTQRPERTGAYDTNLVIETKGAYLRPNIPENWQVSVIRLDGKGEINSTGYIGSTPQQAGIFPYGKAMPIAEQCTVTNYGSVPVFVVRMEIEIKLFEIIPHPTQPNSKVSAKEPKISRKIPVWINKIDPGPSNAVSFFLVNLTPLFAAAWLPSHAMAAPLGATAQSVLLTYPTLTGVPHPISLSGLDEHA